MLDLLRLIVLSTVWIILSIDKMFISCIALHVLHAPVDSANINRKKVKQSRYRPGVTQRFPAI
jgi:hypothetical protein